MKRRKSSFMLPFFLVGASIALNIGTPILSGNVLAEELQIIESSEQRTEDEHVMLRGDGENSCLHSSTDKLSRADQIMALESVLVEHPEFIIEALAKKQIELVELVEQASVLKDVQAEKDRRLAEMKQPKVPMIHADRPMRGNPEAMITIVEYSDFECPYCRSASTTVKEVLEQYGEAVRFVYKHNPLNFHPMAEPAARYFEAIAMQDVEQAWHFHDRVFEQQDQLADGEQVLKVILESLNVDVTKVKRDLYGEAIEQRLRLDRDETGRFGFDGTPAFLINGVSLMGSQPKEKFEEIIRLFIQQSKGDRLAAVSQP